jgi:hypothetical protein
MDKSGAHIHHSRYILFILILFLSGSISTSELSKVVQSLGVKASDNDIKKLMKLMDADDSGSISFEEFKYLLVFFVCNFPFSIFVIALLWELIFTKSPVIRSFKKHSSVLIKTIQVLIQRLIFLFQFYNI